MHILKLFFILFLASSFQTMQAQDEVELYLKKVVQGSFEQVSDRTKEVLKEQGFGVITEIDMDAKLREKLENIEMRPYRILGVCNPSYAYRSLQVEENIGVFLPCKAIIKDLGEGKIEVVIVNPAVLMGMLGSGELVDIAIEVEDKFRLALEKL